MMITPELLKKYHLGQCSPSEFRDVELWLAKHDENGNAIFPVHENEEQVKEIMWKDISSFLDDDEASIKKSGRVRPLHWLRQLRYAAAASLLLALIGWNAYRWSATMREHNVTELVMDNLKGGSARKMDNSGLVFTLMPKSKAESKTDWSSRSGFVNFCGNILITNNSDEDIELSFNTSCQNPRDTQKTLKCQKGKTYVAIHYKFNDDEILVFDKSELATTLLPIQVYNELERI